MDISELVKLTAKAWSLDILRSMASNVPGKQAALITATGAGRTAFGQSMAHLIDLGFVQRNPGHGHPLRPEFVLTEKGMRMGAVVKNVYLDLPHRRGHPLLRRAWTVPLLTCTAQRLYFNDIKERLPMISDRSLSLNLQTLEASDWIQRDIDTQARPLRPTYKAINAGAHIGRHFQMVLV